jgi:hypothetical protein
MKYLLVRVYQVGTNKSPWVKIGAAQGGGLVFPYMCILKTFKKSSYKNPKEIELRYLSGNTF